MIWTRRQNAPLQGIKEQTKRAKPMFCHYPSGSLQFGCAVLRQNTFRTEMQSAFLIADATHGRGANIALDQVEAADTSVSADIKHTTITDP